MIKKINRIKNLGLVFANYSWDPSVPAFNRFNLIYGWNGSGKTTLSRLFNAVSGVLVGNLEYEIEDENGVKYIQGHVFPKKTRVFNQDYIQNNVKILESRTNTISISLGEGNKELIEKIESDRKLLEGDSSLDSPGMVSTHAQLIRNKQRKEDERDRNFTEIAKVIGAAIGGNALRDYRKPQAEKDFALLTEKNELSANDLEKLTLSSKQDSLPTINPFVLQEIKEEQKESIDVLRFLRLVAEEAGVELQKTVETETISRLTSNEDISRWVEQGLGLHNKHKSEVCEYCLQKIPITRINQLSRHFNEADKKLKESLDVLVDKLKQIYSTIQSLGIPDSARFYKDLQNDIDSMGLEYETKKKNLLSSITSLAEEIKFKKSKTTQRMTLKSQVDGSDFITTISEINKIINSHNKRTSEFDEIKKISVQRLKSHYLSTIFDNVKNQNAEVSKLTKDIFSLEAEVASTRKRISDNLTQVSSQHSACEDINKKLAIFLGHQELCFVPHMEKKTGEDKIEKGDISGYDIMRGDKLAVYLSEGEKTAIAFVYFVVHLGDQNFNAHDGIILIDDPISSLDSNFLYQAFSFLKNAVKNGGQVFILTHSFEFLKLLINWRRHAERNTTAYYMIKNVFLNDVRCAHIDMMDKELSEYESEYHYLFKLLKQFQIENDDTIAKSYPIPNIARKVWDTFLMFSVPNGEDSYKKMGELKAAGKDEEVLDAIYKFTNDQSHITGSGFDPALVPGTKKVINEMFDMMSTISPEHFKIIDRVTN